MTFDLQIHHMTFDLEAQTTVHMGPQAGGQIRGSLWQALNESTCTAPSERGNPKHSQHCPMCFLLELKEHSPRGQNPPRPFAVRPPLGVRAEDDRVFSAGERFEIGLTLMGNAASLFPYVVNGMWHAGQGGVGYHRGQFAIKKITNHNPLTQEKESLLDGNDVHLPKISVGQKDISKSIQGLSSDKIRLRFLTPTTLKHQGKILDYPEFVPLIARLLERCQALAHHYGKTESDQSYWKPIYDDLTEKAKSIRRVQDNTRLVQFRSGSRRSNYSQTISGFVGDVLFEGDITPFHEWLLWGQSLQVGKNTVKGNGWYEIADIVLYNQVSN